MGVPHRQPAGEEPGVVGIRRQDVEDVCIDVGWKQRGQVLLPVDVGNHGELAARLQTTQADLLVFKTMDPGETYEKAITDVGTFFYYCGIHNQMWGKITVEE